MADDGCLSEKQHILSIQLGKYVSAAKDAYLGAIHALYFKEYDDRLAQFAYSLREVIDLLTRKNQNDVERRSPIAKEDRAMLLASIIDPVGKQVYEFNSLYQQLTRQYGELSSYAHHSQILEQKDAEERLKIIEGILSRFTRPQIDILDDIDEILSVEPSKKEAVKLKEHLFRWSSHSYLLEKLPCEWLESLYNAGFFDNPQPITSNQQDSGKFYYWMPSGYLVKCVGFMPDLVSEIILKCQFKNTEERNPAVYDDFLKCSLDFSVTNMQKIAQKAIDEKWHDFAEHYLIAEQYAELAERLYLEGKYDIAIKMMSVLFGSIKTNSLKFYDNYTFEEILNKKISRLAEKNPLPVAKFLASFIESAIKHDNAKLEDDKSKQYDSSHLLLDAIEDHEQNHSKLYRILPLCIIKLRDCLVYLGHTDPQELKSNMSVLSEKKYVIFRRLEIFLYDQFNSFFKDEITRTLVDFLDTPQVHHEYYNLIKNTFGKIPNEIQEKIINKIEKTSLEKFNDAKINEGEKVANSQKKYWILHKLEPIHEYLEGKNKKLYEDLALELGKIKNPNFLSYVEVSMGKSAVDPKTFEGKTLDEIFEIVKKYSPINNIMMPSEDRIVASFEDYVSKNPLECSKKSSDIVDADLKIQYAFLSGLGTAINSKKQVDWVSLLPVIKITFENAISSTSYRSTSFNPVMESFRIIEHGLKETKLDYLLKDQIWEIITQMIKIGNNHPGHEKYPNESTDSLTMMINDLGGLSLSALFRYVIWCNDNEKSKHVFTKQVKKVVGDYVGKLHGHHTIAKHAALGLYTPTMFYFDEDWTDKLLDGKIFSSMDVKIAFWDSYVINNVNKHSLTHLYNLYREFLNSKILNGFHEKNVYQSTVDHVVLGYLYDVENYDKLFEDFISSADAQSINHCGFFVSRILADNSDVATFKDKIESLWQNQKFIDHVDLIRWSAKSPFDKKKTIELILQYMKRYREKFNATRFLLDELDEYIDDYPFDVAQCIQLFLNNLDNSNYLPRHMEDMIKSLLSKKMENVNKICQNIIEKLVENGHNEYKDLI